MANAGPDQTVAFGQAVQLAGAVVFSNSTPVIQWKFYSGPGTVAFGNAVLTNTTAAFSAPGNYTLELSADDGIHAVAFDAVVITVTSAINLSVTQSGTNLDFTWIGGSPPFVLQQAGTLPMAAWSDLVTTSTMNASVPMTNGVGFFRVQGR